MTDIVDRLRYAVPVKKLAGDDGYDLLRDAAKTIIDLREQVADLEMIRNPGYMDEKMAARFRSGNEIPVERAWVTRVEWDAWLQRLADAEKLK